MLFWGSWRKGDYNRQPVLGAVEWGAVVKVVVHLVSEAEGGVQWAAVVEVVVLLGVVVWRREHQRHSHHKGQATCTPIPPIPPTLCACKLLC